MIISRKKKDSSKKRIKFILLVILTFLLWTIITIFNQWSDIKDINNQLVKLQEEEKRALNNKAIKENEVLMLKNYEYIAEIARKYYFLSKPGEIIIISPEE